MIYKQGIREKKPVPINKDRNANNFQECGTGKGGKIKGFLTPCHYSEKQKDKSQLANISVLVLCTDVKAQNYLLHYTQLPKNTKVFSCKNVKTVLKNFPQYCKATPVCSQQQPSSLYFKA